MTALLLSVHVVLAVLSVGPVTVAASLFPPAVRAAWAAAPQQVKAGALAQPRDEAEHPLIAAGQGQAGGEQVVRLLHRITRTYAAVGLAVPVFGLATAASLRVLTDAWVLVAVALTAVAATALVGLILPLQRRLLASTPDAPVVGGPGQVTAAQTALTTRLVMATGVFNLLWVLVTVLMVWRPGQHHRGVRWRLHGHRHLRRRGGCGWSLSPSRSPWPSSCSTWRSCTTRSSPRQSAQCTEVATSRSSSGCWHVRAPAAKRAYWASYPASAACSCCARSTKPRRPPKGAVTKTR